MTTDIAQRLEAALHARAELVQPEDLQAFAPLVAPTPDHPRWRRATSYVAAAAACAAAVAGAYALSDHDQSKPEPAPRPGPPEGWVGGIGRTGQGADLPGTARQTADVDGDGEIDSVWVRTSLGRTTVARVEVLLSSAPDAVRWTLLDVGTQSGGLEGAVQLDDDPGEEMVVSTDDGHTYEFMVVDLVDGRLQQVPVAGERLRSGQLPDGRTSSPRVVDGQLLSWQSRERIAEGTRYVRVDATWWRIGEVDGVRSLVVAERGDLCMDLFEGPVGPCLTGDKPDAEPPNLGPDNIDDYVPDFLPVETRQLDIGQDLPYDDNGTPATARLSGPVDSPVLEVETGGKTLSADLGPGDPVRLLDGVVPGDSGPGLLVLRESGDATIWSVWSVRDSGLVELWVADDAPFGSGFLDEGRFGLQPYRTELSESGLLYTAVGGVTDDPEVQDVWVWTLDEGPGVVARGLSCFRFPTDGSDPDFSAC